jgi:hypothetical protein
MKSGEPALWRPAAGDRNDLRPQPDVLPRRPAGGEVRCPVRGQIVERFRGRAEDGTAARRGHCVIPRREQREAIVPARIGRGGTRLRARQVHRHARGRGATDRHRPAYRVKDTERRRHAWSPS